jgi:hypothetical protein
MSLPDGFVLGFIYTLKMETKCWLIFKDYVPENITVDVEEYVF